MANDADRASPNITSVVDDGLAKIRREIAESLPYIGVCHWCAETILDGLIFCSRDCIDDFQRDKEGRIRNGNRQPMV